MVRPSIRSCGSFAPPTTLGSPGKLLPFPISDFNMRILRIGSADASITPLYLRLFWSTGRDNWTACLLSSDCPGIGHRQRRAQRRGGYLRFVLSNEVGLAIHRLSQSEGVTPFMILLAAFQTLLYRYSGQDDIVVGAPAANRSRVELDDAIGLFANVVALRTNLADRPSFRELLARVRSVVLAAFRQQELPFETLVKSLELDRDSASSPVFQVMFAYQNVPRSSWANERTDSGDKNHRDRRDPAGAQPLCLGNTRGA